MTYSPDQYEKENIKGNVHLIATIADYQSSILFSMGHQVVYSVHNDVQKDIHIHFAINSVNFNTGKMLNYSVDLNKQLNALMTEISYREIAKHMEHPRIA